MNENEVYFNPEFTSFNLRHVTKILFKASTKLSCETSEMIKNMPGIPKTKM